jgi:hypothetical protein
MRICCEHSADEHNVVEVCQQVIHYPSEDYPCVCNGLVVEGEVCAACGHPVGLHVRERVCRPGSGEFCSCRGEQ